VFTPPTGDPFRGPRERVLQAPDFAGAIAMWGSTGRDNRGHIWFGFSACCNGGSARPYEFDPQNDLWRDHGSVTDQLKATGAYRQGEGQIKIHSRIVPAGDGRLNFVSADEESEKADGSVLPRWDSHLWCIDPESGKWQHLMAAPEGLIAVAGVGRYVYALGYWNHVLYQYDTLTGATTRREIGSVGGHISLDRPGWVALRSDLRRNGAPPLEACHSTRIERSVKANDPACRSAIRRPICCTRAGPVAERRARFYRGRSVGNRRAAAAPGSMCRPVPRIRPDSSPHRRRRWYGG